MDMYLVGCSQRKGDAEDAEDFLMYRMWEGANNVFGLDKDWVTTIIRRGKQKAILAWEKENLKIQARKIHKKA